ncbi:hypothetical protein FOL47_008035 [Perkinsus chesapeaki]|uniref:Uncharacterized protein n=1 Tax=Perkinsus chesapeaki TaxID=330153 RepID=A0A7J6N4Q8_PERCH|nr:hypothetical protein FOL47_008035 [Perkinsus chesapeaki]
MRILINVILSVVACAIVDNGPTGSYCGAADTFLGKATINISITSSSTFNIEASWTPIGGETESGSENDVEYEYDTSTGKVTVKGLDKLKNLIARMGAPLSADMLAQLEFKDDTLYVTRLANFPLKSC